MPRAVDLADDHDSVAPLLKIGICVQVCKADEHRFEDDVALNDFMPLVVRSKGRIVILDTDEISWVEADGNYVCVHTANSSHKVRSCIRDFYARLDPQRFSHIHRSFIVNL